MGASECEKPTAITFCMARHSRDTRAHTACVPTPDNGPEKEIVYLGNIRPDVVEYILYEATDFLRAKGHILWNAQRTWRQFRPHCAMYSVIVAWNRSSRCVHE